MNLPNLYTKAKVSPAGKLNSADLKKWRLNLFRFLAPLSLVYLGQISMTLQHGALGWVDFIPTPVTLGAIELYVVNALTDLVLKFTDSNK